MDKEKLFLTYPYWYKLWLWVFPTITSKEIDHELLDLPNVECRLMYKNVFGKRYIVGIYITPKKKEW